MVCFTFMVLISDLFLLIRSMIMPRTALAAENLALRKQLAVINRKVHRPQLHRHDRFFWVILSQLWKAGLPHEQLIRRYFMLSTLLSYCFGERSLGVNRPILHQLIARAGLSHSRVACGRRVCRPGLPS